MFQRARGVRRRSMSFGQSANVPNSSILLKLVYYEMRTGENDYEATRTLRLYFYCMLWKLWKLLQITFGYWDDDVSYMEVRRVKQARNSHMINAGHYGVRHQTASEEIR